MILKMVEHTEGDLSILQKQNVVFSSSLVSYQTFQGWDWLGSLSILNL